MYCGKVSVWKIFLSLLKAVSTFREMITGENGVFSDTSESEKYSVKHI